MGVVGTRELLADHLSQLALAGDEGAERGRAVVVGRLDELDHALHRLAEAAGVAGHVAEPEDQLVEQQDDHVVAEGARVAAEDPQAAVDVDEARGRLGERLEVGPRQHGQ